MAKQLTLIDKIFINKRKNERKKKSMKTLMARYVYKEKRKKGEENCLFLFCYVSDKYKINLTEWIQLLWKLRYKIREGDLQWIHNCRVKKGHGVAGRNISISLWFYQRLQLEGDPSFEVE